MYYKDGRKVTAAEDVKFDRNVEKGVTIKMEEERIKVAATATATIRAAARNHLIL